MPYFERKPFAEIQPVLTPKATLPEPSADELAASVLTHDTQPCGEDFGPFRTKEATQPGYRATVILGVSALDGPAQISLHPDDLRGPSGRKIPARDMTITPASLTLKPGEEADVEVSVYIPGGTPAGSYTGRVSASGDLLAKFRVDIEVA